MGTIEQMHGCMADYFSAEKTESLIFVLVGMTAITASALLYLKAPSFRGMIIPLVLIALIQIAVGGAVYLRTDAQVAGLSRQLDADPAACKAAEVPRMEAVMRAFTTYKLIEIALLAAGIALTFVFRRNDFWYSMGIGLIIQPSFMLVLDLLAERRGEAYLECLKQLLA
ncbi:MAG: hypothetical protein EPN93_14235 [Spirochaetes bacterium]|nr:MAG: hypothetical protein EPN93_14235 [Spirochaetota bacterium]